MWYNISVSLFLEEIMCFRCVLNELLEPFSLHQARLLRMSSSGIRMTSLI